MLILLHAVDILQSDQDHIDLVLSQPIQSVDHRRLEIVERYISQRIVGSDLPQHHVGLDQGDLVLDP